MAAKALEALGDEKMVRTALLYLGELLAIVTLFLYIGFSLPRISSTQAAPAGELCGNVKAGMSVQEVEQVTRRFEGWQILRSDGVMVVSAHSINEKLPVCRVHFDSQERVDEKTVGPIVRGDWPVL